MVDHNFDPNAPAGSGQAGLKADGERVAKALARAGVASRREVERLITAGRVRLNGRVLDTPAVKITPGDVLTVDGAVVAEAEATRVWRYHKPAGLVTTHADPKGRPTVFDHLPQGLPRVISVGRLDLNTEGLLLLTNDGALARALELPATGLVRRYRARARGVTSQERLDRLKDGITVDGVHYGAIEAKLDKAKESASPDGRAGANLWITLTLTEGKNREVRKVLEAIGLTVNRLIRQSYGPFQLGVLAAGEVEEVGPRVIREQLARHIAPESLPTGDHAVAPPVKGAAARRGPGQAARGQSAGALSRDALPKKTEYKPGWAKPKKRAGPPRPKVARPKADRPMTDGPMTGRLKAERPKPERAKTARATTDRPKPDRPKTDRLKTDRPKTERPKTERAKTGARRDGPATGGGPKPRR
jgi:23S rRNA pseudouridine2605 synthase